MSLTIRLVADGVLLAAVGILALGLSACNRSGQGSAGSLGCVSVTAVSNGVYYVEVSNVSSSEFELDAPIGKRPDLSFVFRVEVSSDESRRIVSTKYNDISGVMSGATFPRTGVALQANSKVGQRVQLDMEAIRSEIVSLGLVGSVRVRILVPISCGDQREMLVGEIAQIEISHP